MKSIKVVAAIILHDNLIFATQRGYGDFKGGWEFPGGKIEPGETPQEALVRELREEMDYEVFVEKELVTVHHQYPDFSLDLTAFLCSVSSIEFTFAFVPKAASHGVKNKSVYKSYPFILNLLSYFSNK